MDVTHRAEGSVRLPLVLVPQYFGCVVFDRRTSRYLPFDEEATALLVRLASCPIDVVLAGTAEVEERGRIAAFFEAFYARGFFTLGGRLAGEVRSVSVPPDHLVGPLALHLEVVAACNLTCTHCFAGALPRKANPLTLAELDRLFAEMAQLGTFRLGLTGGEPLLRKDIFQVIDLAVSHGLCPCLTTNGLLITEEIAREFGKRELVWLNVSLEGATAETNDRVRGEGTFARVLDRLAVLGMHARFTLAFTIMRSNLQEIQQCAELAAKVGAHTAVFRPLYPVGVARQHPELMPTYQEYRGALDLLARLERREEFSLNHIDPFSPRTRHASQSVIYDNYGCGAGNLVCSVSVSGEVNPCSFLGPEFIAASVREKSLAEIWHQSRVFQDLRNLPVTERASRTGRDATFAGGCRARALVLNGSIDAPDPWITAQVEAEVSAASQPSPTSLVNPLAIVELDKSPRLRPMVEPAQSHVR